MPPISTSMPREDLPTDECPSKPPKQVLDALAAWVARHQTPLWRYLRLLGCGPELADELVQDALLAAIDRGMQDRNDGRVLGWLRGVARNLWRMHCRRSARRREVPDSDLVERAWRDHGEPDGGQGYLMALRVCVDMLDHRERRALQLRYAEQASRAAIATELAIGEEAVKSLLHRLRARLRKCVEHRRGARA